MGTTTRAVPLAAAVALVAAAVLGAVPPATALTPATVVAAGAQAEDARSARRAAQHAEATVSRLTARLDEQLAARDRVMADLTSAVQGSIRSEQVADSAAQQAAASRGRHGRTVRALYRSGGRIAVYASVLDAGSVSDALDRTAMARRVLTWTSSHAQDHSAAASDAVTAADQAAAGAAAQVVTVADVIAAGEQIERTLAEAQAELEKLSHRASTLEAADLARQRLAAARARAAAAASGLGRGASTVAAPVPPDYLVLYQRAADRCPGMRWTLLAAVGQVESRHGVYTGPSSAGAVGPMQFMPRTFAAYGVDGDGDGIADPWNPADAIESAARYLCANGGGGDAAQVQRALLRYNNAQWYVDLVLGVEADLVSRTLAPSTAGRAARP